MSTRRPAIPLFTIEMAMTLRFARLATLLATPLAAVALCVLASAAIAQTAAEVVTITGKTLTLPSVAGFGDLPLARAPLQASIYNRESLSDANVNAIADLTRLDASLSDAYNTEGYWSYLTVRGFVIDNRANYRRDGLPINAETFISLANKDRVEVLKGTSGMQAGTSAPGGLVNLVVKRPQGRVRSLSLDWQQDGSLGAQADLAERAGIDGQFGWRLNLQAVHLQPAMRAAIGQSHLWAIATDWQITPDSKLEFEFEQGHRAQPSAPGFSLLGNKLPDASKIDPRTNLNNQPWSLPVVLDGTTASLRWQHRLNGDWNFTAHGVVQKLKSDDRVAFPFGCYDAASGVYYADRYCPNGSFDLYDFRSDGERRQVKVLDLHLDGKLRAAGLQHTLTAGVQSTHTHDRFNLQAFNFAGTGNIGASAATPSAPDLLDQNTNRNETSTEWYARDVMTLSPAWQLWGGLRHTQLRRTSVRTNGSRSTSSAQSFTTPFLALTWAATSTTTAYASAGQGVESEVVPNRSRYTNRGETLAALKSKQFEIGLKDDSANLPWSVTAFDITRPVSDDLKCTNAGLENERCTRTIDGNAHHRGLEAALGWSAGPWAAHLSSLWLIAQREGASDFSLNGLRPSNVPKSSQRAELTYDMSSLPGLRLQANVVHEGNRAVLPDNSITAPGWTRLDLAVRYRQKLASTTLTWRVGVQNATDHRAWRESPYQFGHSYLFPLPGRAWHASLQADI